MKIIYVDCCRTLVSMDTYPSFFVYCKRYFGMVYLFKYYAIRILNRLGVNLKKEILIRLVSDIDPVLREQVINTYVSDVLIPKLIPQTIDVLSQYRSEYRIVLVSGGIKEYLSILAKYLGYDYVLAETIYGCKDKKLIVGEEKVIAIENFENSLNEPIHHRIAIGDSSLDIPMFEYCDKVYVVSGSCGHMVDIARLRKWDLITHDF